MANNPLGKRVFSNKERERLNFNPTHTRQIGKQTVSACRCGSAVTNR